MITILRKLILYCLFLPYLVLFYGGYVLSASDLELTNALKQTLKISKPFDCDKLVPEVREISRKHLEIKKFSIEQITNRIVIEISTVEVVCSGTAILSNTLRRDIKYKAFVDTEGDWILEYELFE